MVVNNWIWAIAYDSVQLPTVRKISRSVRICGQAWATWDKSFRQHTNGPRPHGDRTDMAKSRLSMRREVEAAETTEKKTPKRKKTATKKKATRKKATSRVRRSKDVVPRRRLVWVVYSSTMREEGRYLYHEREKADEKLGQLLAKGKRRYFIQPIKEPLDSEGNPKPVVTSLRNLRESHLG